MPIPRVFVSSTCYDLQEIRQNLRQFIHDFSYDPVMSEFGDIFYEYDSHVQDACLKEVEKCQLFILIVGNNYGSIYHKQQSNIDVPDSVTLREFKKAISVEIPKHIFINRFVHYDYMNYRRALDSKLKDYFDSNEISNDKVRATVNEIRKKFDSGYHFANKAYKYIFQFLDVISDLKKNNAIFPFETFTDIQSQLKKQWAGYVYDALTREKTVALSTVDNIASRIDNIENLLNQLIETRNDNDNGRIIDINRLAGNVAYNELEKMQALISRCLNDIMYFTGEYGNYEARGYIKEELTEKTIELWIRTLGGILNKFKWAKTIPFHEIWEGITVVEEDYAEEISYKTLLDLYGIYEGLPEEEKQNLVSTITLRLKSIVRNDDNVSDEYPTFDPDDDIPF